LIRDARCQVVVASEVVVRGAAGRTRPMHLTAEWIHPAATHSSDLVLDLIGGDAVQSAGTLFGWWCRTHWSLTRPCVYAGTDLPALRV
jgi:hypothetical protein